MAKRVVGWLLHPEDRDGLMAVLPPVSVTPLPMSA
jgi:hypothetical protein